MMDFVRGIDTCLCEKCGAVLACHSIIESGEKGGYTVWICVFIYYYFCKSKVLKGLLFEYLIYLATNLYVVSKSASYIERLNKPY